MERASVICSLTNLVSTRDKDEYHEEIGLLLSNPASQSLIEELTAKEYESIFYCCTGESFIGLTRTGCQKLRNLARPHFTKETDFFDFFQKSVQLNIEITDTLCRSFNHFESHTVLCEWDPRV